MRAHSLTSLYPSTLTLTSSLTNGFSRTLYMGASTKQARSRLLAARLPLAWPLAVAAKKHSRERALC